MATVDGPLSVLGQRSVGESVRTQNGEPTLGMDRARPGPAFLNQNRNQETRNGPVYPPVLTANANSPRAGQAGPDRLRPGTDRLKPGSTDLTSGFCWFWRFKTAQTRTSSFISGFFLCFCAVSPLACSLLASSGFQ